MKIKVKNLLPNPFRNIDAYPIDREKIRQLRNSIKETGFWDNILGRLANGYFDVWNEEDGYVGKFSRDKKAIDIVEGGHPVRWEWMGKVEIAYGHHRLVAIKEELGEETVVDIPVRNLSDEDMLRIMANENMQEWSTDWRVIRETILQAKKFLMSHLEIAEKYGNLSQVRGEIGDEIISNFLGKNWSKSSVNRALRLIRQIDIKKMEKIELANSKGTSGMEEKRIKIPMRVISEASRIKDERQKYEWLQQVKQVDITQDEMEEITRFENEPTLTSQDKQTLRSLIQQDEIRGKKQIKRAYDLYKAQRLTIPRMRRETEDARKWIQDRLEEIAEDAKHLGRLITAMGDRIAQNPEVIALLPEEQMLEASQAVQELYSALTNFRNTYQAAKKKSEKSKPTSQIEEIEIG